MKYELKTVSAKCTLFIVHNSSFSSPLILHFYAYFLVLHLCILRVVIHCFSYYYIPLYLSINLQFHAFPGNSKSEQLYISNLIFINIYLLFI